jgi:hypothetical protein
VWLVCALLLGSAVGLTGWSVLRQHGTALAAGTVFVTGALATGLYDQWLTAATLLVALLLAATVAVRWRTVEVRAAAGMLVAGSLAGSAWTWGAIAGGQQPWTALATLVLLAVVTLLLPRVTRLRRFMDRAGSTLVGVEVGGGCAAAVVAVAGVDGAAYALAATWTAVYLTVAGAAVTAMSLLRADRHRLGWLGGGLLAAASWVRLWDIGVEVPEPYTLPAAAALGAVGLVHLRRDPSASTVTALASALGLALVPSLLWVLWEPATLRSLLLGAACLGLLVVGLRLRWTAPVLFASTVGGFVVLRHAAPYLGDAVPRWLLIAAAGTVLIGMGVTWERRIQEARAVVGYVRALR